MTLASLPSWWAGRGSRGFADHLNGTCVSSHSHSRPCQPSSEPPNRPAPQEHMPRLPCSGLTGARLQGRASGDGVDLPSRAALCQPCCPAVPSHQLTAKPGSPASRPAVRAGWLEPIPRLQVSSGGNQSRRGSPAGLSASPGPGSQRRGRPCCRGPWWAALQTLPPLCQNQQEHQAPFAPLPPKVPKAAGLGLPPPGKQGERGPALLLVASVVQGRGRRAEAGVPQVLPVCLVRGPSLEGTSVPCHIPPLPCASTRLSGHPGAGGQPRPHFPDHTQMSGGLGAFGEPGRRPPEPQRLGRACRTWVQPTAWLRYFASAGSAWPEHKGDFLAVPWLLLCSPLHPAAWTAQDARGSRAAITRLPCPAEPWRAWGPGQLGPPQGLEKRPCRQLLAPQPLPSFPEH